MTLMSPNSVKSRFARLLPIKPAAPVTRTVFPVRLTLYSSIILISSENVSCVDLILNIVEACVVAVGYDGLGLGFEGFEVVDHPAAEEAAAVFEGRFINNDLRAFGLDALHYALDGTLSEVVAVGLHRQTVDTYDASLFFRTVPLAVAAVVAGFREHLVGYEVLAGAVGVHYRLDKVLRDVVVVREELLRVFRKAVAAVAEGRVVVLSAYARVEADAVYNRLGVKTFHLGVGVQFIEVAHAECEVGVREELHRLRLCRAHEEHRDILFQSTFFYEGCECVCSVFERLISITDYDAARIEVVIEGFAFP